MMPEFVEWNIVYGYVGRVARFEMLTLGGRRFV